MLARTQLHANRFLGLRLGFGHLLHLALLVVPATTQKCTGRVFPGTTSDPRAFARSYDYVIVGGGTAGLALASRLTDDPNVHVGVIEAGIFHQDDPLIDEPVNAGLVNGNPDYDWNFVSVPQPNANGRAVEMPRGKMIGGSSGLNSLAWTRGSKPEYDAWHALSGDAGWGWDGLLLYLKKAAAVFDDEANGAPQTAADSYESQFEGFDGPVSASYNAWYSDPFPLYQEALQKFGLSVNTDPDNGTTRGITNTRSDVDRPTGTRSYAAAAYYCRFGTRANFHVLTGAQATKVLARKASDGVVATGVAYASGGNTFIANVTRDVILAAGSFQSPQLLELSGIGNKTLLSGLGIETLLDLPGVGENLQDHLFVATQFQLKPGTLTYDELRINATFAAEQSALYNATGTGLLAGTDSALTFLPFSAFLSAADTQAMLTAFDAFVASTSPSPLAAAQYAIHRSWLEDGNVPQVEVIMWSKGVIDVAANESYITVLGGGVHHLYRGSVHINSSDGLAHPTINPSFLTNEFDTATVLHALKLAQSTGGLDPLSTIVVEQTAPGALNDTALLSYIRETVSTASHPIGTAAMARRELGGVVDSGLKVYGTTNLRVCDASVFPLSIGTHLQSTVYAVAEKLADVIKTEHSY